MNCKFEQMQNNREEKLSGVIRAFAQRGELEITIEISSRLCFDHLRPVKKLQFASPRKRVLIMCPLETFASYISSKSCFDHLPMLSAKPSIIDFSSKKCEQLTGSFLGESGPEI